MSRAVRPNWPEGVWWTTVGTPAKDDPLIHIARRGVRSYCGQVSRHGGTGFLVLPSIIMDGNGAYWGRRALCLACILSYTKGSSATGGLPDHEPMCCCFMCACHRNRKD